MLRNITFDRPVCGLEMLLNDIDNNDVAIVNVKSNGVTIPLTAADVLSTGANITTVGTNQFESTVDAGLNNTDVGGVYFQFQNCIDEVEIIFYDDLAGPGVAGTEGGSYSISFPPICGYPEDQPELEEGCYTVYVTDASGAETSAEFCLELTDVEDPVLVCPADITVSADPGSCTAVVSWTPPVPTDDCPDVMITSSTANPGDAFPVGTTTVTYVAMDAAGNSVTCNFEVIVEDTEDPEIFCPGDITVSTDPGACSAVVTWVTPPPTVTDNCPNPAITSSTSDPGDTFPIGTTQVTYTATDAAGNTATCNFNVTVEDTEDPSLTCPADITVNAAMGTCEAVVSWTPPIPDDNCPGVIIMGSNSPGETFTVGTSTVTYIAVDAAGNSTTCSFVITVNDVEAPPLSCPVSIVANNDQGVCGAVVNWTPPVPVEGSCLGGGITLVSDFDPGDTFPVGTTTVTYTATDDSNNSATCSFNVTVEDTEPPVWSCINDIAVSNDLGACSATVSWVNPTVTDNCGVTSFSSNFNSGDTFPLGTTTVTYTAVDAAGNSTECSFNIIVEDTEDPVLTCPADIVVSTASGLCNATVSWPLPSIADNCNATITGSTSTPGTIFPVGTTTVTYTAEDDAGNFVTCSFTVTVEDNEAPELTCPADIVLETQPGECNLVAEWTVPTATDNCGVASFSSNYSTGDSFPIGTTTVTYIAVDAAGNSMTCSFDVIVNECVGTTSTSTVTLLSDQDIFIGTNDTESFADNGTQNYTDPATPSNAILSNITLELFFRVDGASCESDIEVQLTDPAGNINTFTNVFGTCNGTGSLYNVVLSVPSGATTGSIADWVAEFRDTNDQNAGAAEYSVRFGRLIYDATVSSSCADPIIVNCPADIIQTADAGMCSADISIPVPVFGTDFTDCTNATITNNYTGTSDASGTYPVGTTTVTWTVIDAQGNTTTCTQTVIVSDDENPVVTCPADVTVETTPGMCTATAMWMLPTFSDNCGASITSSSHNPGDDFPIGTTTVTYTVEDANGNMISCSFNIIVNECTNGGGVTETETITLISDQDLFVGSADAESFVSNGNYMFADPATPASAVLSNITLQLFFRVNGASCESDIEIRLTDPTGNVNVFMPFTTCNGSGPLYNTILNIPSGNTTGNIDNWVVEFRDTNDQNAGAAEYSVRFGRLIYDATTTTGGGGCADPVIVNCPAGISMLATSGICGADVTISEPMFGVDFTDCFNATITNDYTGTSDASGFYPVGTTMVTWTVTDEQGNTATCTQTVSIIDTQEPTLTCPADVTVTTTPGTCDAIASWTLPVVGDNCNATITSNSHNSGDVFPIGTTTVTYTATDDSGNTATCTFDVIVEECGSGGATVSTETLISDADINVGNTDTESFADNGTYTFTDPATPANATLSNITLELFFRVDGASCESDIEVQLTDPAGNVNVFTPFATCTGSGPLYNIVLNVPSGSTTGAIADWVAEFRDTNDQNAGGREYSVRFGRLIYDVSVPTAGGCADPVIVNCPADVNIDAEPGLCGAEVIIPVPVFGVDFTDCTSAIITNDYTGTADGSGFYPVGATTVTWTAIDAQGNTVTCMQMITITATQDPTIVCGGDREVAIDGGACEAVVFWNEPTASDNCDVTLTSDFSSGDTFPIGTTTVTYTVTDASGNAATCSFDVIVTDDEAPMMLCPADISVSNDAGLCSAVVTWPAPMTSDNCQGTTLTSSHNSGDVFPVGTTTVSYTATDASGNTVTCSFDIEVTDDEAPTATCPADVVVPVDMGACYAAVSWPLPTFADNCGAAAIKFSSHEIGDVFLVGTTTVSYTIVDEAGNTTSCSFDVTVEDNIAPKVTCPADIVVGTDTGMCETIVDWLEPTATDNCEATITSSSHNPGDTFPVGTTTVTYTVTDDAGNTGTCSFDVTVEDDEAPMITCPADITVPSVASCGTNVNMPEPTFSDNCPGVTISSSAGSGDFFPVGTTTVTWTAVDAAGNTATCSYNIIVEDVVPPSITCPADITVDTDAGQCTATVNWTPPVATDDCTISILTSTHQPGSVFPLGTTTVTYLALDESGNLAQCSFDVTVEDNEAPSVTCPGDLTVINIPGLCGADVDWVAPTAIDNCNASITGSSHNPGDFFPVGTTTVSYTVTDDDGNTAICEFDITVLDNEEPDYNCPANIVVSADPATCEAIVNWTVPVPSDNCNAMIGGSSHNPGDVFPLGTTEVEYLAIDDAGNSMACTFLVTVEDTTPPVILDCPEDITIDGIPGECEGVAIIPIMDSFTDCQDGLVVSNDFNGSSNASDIYPVGTTSVIWTVTDASGNTATCEQSITVLPIDLVEDQVLVTDKDVFVGALNTESFDDNDSILIVDPGIPANGTVGTVLLDFFFRVEGNSCERDVEMELTDPAGNITIFSAPVSTCTQTDQIFQFLLPAASVPTAASGGGTWKLRFRDILDQNADTTIDPMTGLPLSIEYSVRFGRLTYEVTVPPNCGPGFTGDDNDSVDEIEVGGPVLEEEESSEQIENNMVLYPVPTYDILNIEYTSDAETRADMQVINSQGSLMMTQEIYLYEGLNRIELDATGLLAGTYYLRIMRADGVVTVKPFVKITP